MRILIACEDPVARSALESGLVSLGADVMVAAHGEEAWRLLSSGQGPDLAILSVEMPGPGGLDICRRVQSSHLRPGCILLLTSVDSTRQIAEGIAAGADGFLTLPLRPTELKARLDAAVRRLDRTAAPVVDTEGDGAHRQPAHCEREISSNLSDLPTLREFLRAFCSLLPSELFGEEATDDLELAATEAASNIMRHAYGGKTDQTIRVEAEWSGSALSLGLHHRGTPFDPSGVEAPAFDGTREGGFGVYIINQCVDEVRYIQHPDGLNTVLLMKRRRPQRERANGIDDGTSGRG